tara:strand:- start:696 stop:950 length:255 start_codon:yes stop_codon:yes gene_type:complete
MKLRCQHLQLTKEKIKNKIMDKKEKVIEICNNLEQTIKKAMNVIIKNDNPMFDKPTASASKLKNIQIELMNKYKLTKNDLKWKR